MKKINNLLYAVAALVISLSGCTYDNFEEPKAFITGRIVYQNEAIPVRSNGVQLELYQRGYALFNKVAIHVAQDGSFSANIFDGDYQITRLRGNGPWADMIDTIKFSVKGNAVVEVPVEPYFLIRNPTFTKGTNTIDATFNLQRINTSRQLEEVNLYLSSTTLVDAGNNIGTSQTVVGPNARKIASAIPNLTDPVTLSASLANLPPSITSKGYVYARVAVKTVGVPEMAYSQPLKIMLK